MFAEVIQTIRGYFQTHPRAKRVIIVGGGVLVAIYLYLSFYIAIVPVDTTREDMDLASLEVKVYSSDSSSTNLQNPKKMFLNFIQILPRSFNYFEATTENFTTIKSSHSHNWWPVRIIPLSISPQKELEKVSTSGGACAIETESGEVYTYRCGNPRYLFSQNLNTTPWSIDAKNLLSSYRMVTPFKDGVLGIRSTGTLAVEQPFVYINPDTGESTSFNSPDELVQDIVDIGNIVTDSADKSSPFAVIANTKKQKFYVINLDVSKVVEVVDFPEDTYTSKSNVTCSMAHKKIACYVGKLTDSPENTVSGEDISHDHEHEHDHGTEPKRSATLIFDTTADSEVVEQSVNSYINQIVVTKEGRVYAIDTWDNLVELEKNTQRLIARSVSQMNYVDKLVFIAGDQLYTHNEESGQSHLTFQSEAASLSTVTSYGSQFVTLFATDGTTTSPNTYVYNISDEDYLPSSNNGRLLDILSLYSDVEAVDYQDNSVQIVLKLVPGATPIPVYNADGSGSITYSDEVVKEAQLQILNRIEDLGIRTDKLDIKFMF